MKKIKPHLTFDQRIEIQQMLSHGIGYRAIGKRIGKHETTVSREVKKHLIVIKTEVVRTDANGKIANSPCPKLLKPPFTCNGCPKHRYKCGFDKFVYYAKQAQRTYESTLVTAREGIPLNSQKFYDNDRILKEGLEAGRHLHQIMQAHDLGVSKTTVYRHRQKGYLSVSNIEFPRVVKFKARRGKPRDYVPKGLKIGKAYADFEAYKHENLISHWIEMDTVIGRVGGKAVLTLHFTVCHFMLGFLIDSLASATIAEKILWLKRLLHDNGLSFGQLFPVIITDNGGEFADIFAIENNLNGDHETRLFFCDPCKSWQKPHIEKNHTLLRDILPKGSSFDNLTQDKLNIIMSHLNSTARLSLGGKSPYEVFCFLFSKALPVLLDIDYVSPENVIQSPKLLTNI